MSKHRTLREDPVFLEHMAEFATVEYVDEALRAVTWAICNRPEVYPVVDGLDNVRVAKTMKFIRGGFVIPPLKVWFRVLDEDTVSLLALTKAEDEEDETEEP